MILNTPTHHVQMSFNMYKDAALDIQLEVEFASNQTDLKEILVQMKQLNNLAVTFEGSVKRLGTTVGIQEFIDEFHRLRDETQDAVMFAINNVA